MHATIILYFVVSWLSSETRFTYYIWLMRKPHWLGVIIIAIVFVSVGLRVRKQKHTNILPVMNPQENATTWGQPTEVASDSSADTGMDMPLVDATPSLFIQTPNNGVIALPSDSNDKKVVFSGVIFIADRDVPMTITRSAQGNSSISAKWRNKGQSGENVLIWSDGSCKKITCPFIIEPTIPDVWNIGFSLTYEVSESDDQETATLLANTLKALFLKATLKRPSAE